MTSPYLLAHYQIDIFSNPIRIGQILDELEDYLIKENAQTWAFITAYNPMSHVLDPKENEIRNTELLNCILKYEYLEGEGRDPLNQWIPERSFLILNINRENACWLAGKFCQKAIVLGEKGKPAELIEIDLM